MRKLTLEELNRVSVDEFKKIEKKPIVCVLDNIRSKHNVGSIFRTSDAFLVEEIFLCGVTPKPNDKEIDKTALGATDSVKWSYFENTLDCINMLKEKDFTIIAVEQTTQSINIFEYENTGNKPIALVLGHEICGINDNVIGKCDLSVEIPQFGTKHSLNVSVAFGIIIAELFKKIL